MFQQTEIKQIHGQQVTIKKTGQRSILPSCFFGKKYAHIETTMTYTENGQIIEITIPSVPREEENRDRLIRIKINGQDFSPRSKKAQTILNMMNTFDITDMPVLIDFAIRDKVALAQDTTQRFCLPFLVSQAAGNEIVYHTDQDPTNQSNWRDILKSDTGFIIYNKIRWFKFENNKIIEATAEDIRINQQHIRSIHNKAKKAFQASFDAKIKISNIEKQRQKEFIFPIAGRGLPHHWEICILNIDENNQPSLTIMGTSWPRGMSAAYFKENIESLYLHEILPLINATLSENSYPVITEDRVFFHTGKQFSTRGCGIAASIHVQNILNGTLPNIGKPICQFDQISTQHYASISIEEDALRRVQLALHFESDSNNSPAMESSNEFSQPIKHELSEQAQALVKRLEEYIQSIKGAKLDNANPFNQGFTWLSSSQALNRQANYFLAKHLLDRIRLGHELSDVFDMISIRKNREFILKSRLIQQNKCYANRGMNSETLHQIIQDARSGLGMPKEDVNDYSYWTQCFKFWRSSVSFNANKHRSFLRNVAGY